MFNQNKSFFGILLVACTLLAMSCQRGTAPAETTHTLKIPQLSLDGNRDTDLLTNPKSTKVKSLTAPRVLISENIVMRIAKSQQKVRYIRKELVSIPEGAISKVVLEQLYKSYGEAKSEHNSIVQIVTKNIEKGYKTFDHEIRAEMKNLDRILGELGGITNKLVDTPQPECQALWLAVKGEVRNENGAVSRDYMNRARRFLQMYSVYVDV